MVSGANLVVDPEAGFHHAGAALEFFRLLDAEAALARQHAFAVGDDDLKPLLGGAHRFLQRRYHLADAMGADRSQPMHAERTECPLDTDPSRGAGAAGVARRQILLAGRGRVAVLHDDENAVALVEHVRGDAGDQAVVPEPAVAHDRDGALGHIGSGGARKRHAVAEDRIAERERRECRERMAADIGADMGRADVALRELDGCEHGSLGTTGAEIRRPWRDVADGGQRTGFMRKHGVDAARDRTGVDAVGTGL
jgi:hypothetical protein